MQYCKFMPSVLLIYITVCSILLACFVLSLYPCRLFTAAGFAPQELLNVAASFVLRAMLCIILVCCIMFCAKGTDLYHCMLRIDLYHCMLRTAACFALQALLSVATHFVPQALLLHVLCQGHCCFILRNAVQCCMLYAKGNALCHCMLCIAACFVPRTLLLCVTVCACCVLLYVLLCRHCLVLSSVFCHGCCYCMNEHGCSLYHCMLCTAISFMPYITVCCILLHVCSAGTVRFCHTFCVTSTAATRAWMLFISLYAVCYCMFLCCFILLYAVNCCMFCFTGTAE